MLSSYPPGFTGGAARWGTPGARLCSCEFSTSDVEASIIRINVGRTTHAGASAPTQIAFIAAGFFFARAEFLRDVPFDPLLPWCFRALSTPVRKRDHAMWMRRDGVEAAALSWEAPSCERQQSAPGGARSVAALSEALPAVVYPPIGGVGAVSHPEPGDCANGSKLC